MDDSNTNELADALSVIQGQQATIALLQERLQKASEPRDVAGMSDYTDLWARAAAATPDAMPAWRRRSLGANGWFEPDRLIFVDPAAGPVNATIAAYVAAADPTTVLALRDTLAASTGRSSELEEYRLNMLRDLDIALHGDAIARSATPEEIWYRLLAIVAAATTRERALRDAMKRALLLARLGRDNVGFVESTLANALAAWPPRAGTEPTS